MCQYGKSCQNASGTDSQLVINIRLIIVSCATIFAGDVLRKWHNMAGANKPWRGPLQGRPEGY